MIDGQYMAEEAGTPLDFAFIADANVAQAIADGWFPAYRYSTASDADADYTLQLLPLAVLQEWAHDAGVERSREMTKTEVIWSYLNALGYMGLDAVCLISVGGFTGDTAGNETVTIHGHGFLTGHPGTTTVTIDAVPFTSITIVDNDTITAVSPAHAAEEDLDLVVTNGNGTFTLPGLDYVAP